MRRAFLIRMSGWLALAWSICPVAATAQEPTSRAVECFAQDEAREVPPGSNCSRATLTAYLVPGKYSAATVEQAVDGLEELAVLSPDIDVRRAAIVLIGYLGAHPKAAVPTIDRLARIYEANSSVRVARSIVDIVGANTDSAGAAQLLGKIATRTDDDPYHPSIPARAVMKLQRLGKPGEAVLESLFKQEVVVDPEGAALLRSLQSPQAAAGDRSP